MFEDVEGDPVEGGEVLRGEPCSFSAKVLSEADVEHPMQLVFDAPAVSDGPVQPRRIGLSSDFRSRREHSLPRGV